MTHPPETAAGASGDPAASLDRLALAALGDQAAAIALVRESLGEGYPVMQGFASLPATPNEFDHAEPSVHADPVLASLAGDPGFRRLLAPRP